MRVGGIHDLFGLGFTLRDDIGAQEKRAGVSQRANGDGVGGKSEGKSAGKFDIIRLVGNAINEPRHASERNVIVMGEQRRAGGGFESPINNAVHGFGGSHVGGRDPAIIEHGNAHQMSFMRDGVDGVITVGFPAGGEQLQIILEPHRIEMSDKNF
jgi:hypothetical protein